MFGMWIDFLLVIFVSSILLVKFFNKLMKKGKDFLSIIVLFGGLIVIAMVSISMIFYPVKTECYEIKNYEWSQFDTTYTKSYRNITQTTVEHFRILKFNLKDNEIFPFDNNDDFIDNEAYTIIARFKNPKLVFSDSIKSILYVKKFNMYNKLILFQIFIELSKDYFVSELKDGELFEKR